MSVPLKLGAEPKKMMILGGLLVVAGGIYFFGPSGSDAPKGASKTAAAPPSVRRVVPPPETSDEVEATATKGGPAAEGKAAARDFKPSMKRRPGQTTDPEKADPTLRTDLLAKLSGVHLDRGERSLFDFSAVAASPKPKLPDPKIVVGQPVKRMIGPVPPPPPPPPPEKQPPPRIPLKFFGRALPMPNGTRRVFCIVNDEVNVASEGDVLQRRFKIHRITATTVLVEDLSFKDQQTLPIEEPIPQGG